MKVFLTGGSGLVGSHVAALLRARGDEVSALQRPGSDVAYLRSLGCRIVEGDVRECSKLLAPRMEGCDAVVHAAALIYAEMPWPRVRAVNVEGTGNVLRAARRAGVRRAVHVSSVAVYGNPPGPISEETPLDHPLGPADLYARSKREAEALAWELHEPGVFEVTVLRPPALYGERDRLFAPKLARMLRRPVVPLLGGGRNTVAVAYAGNVADAVVRALEGRGAGKAFNVTEDHPLTQRELLEGLARGLGLRPRFVTVPGGVVRFGAGVGDRLGIRIPGARDLSLGRVVRVALEDNPYPSERARRELGWDPPFEHAEALERTGAWLRERGF